MPIPVVFVAQLGEPGSCWAPVVDRLKISAELVTYDRPGLGDCPPRPAPNPPLPYSVFADELAAVLDDRGVTEPAVVVGHSVGSLIARMFASRHPDRTAGLVHVDGSIPRLRFGPGREPAGIEDPVDGDHAGATAFDIVNGEIEIVEARRPDVPAAVITRTPGWWPSDWPDVADRMWTAYQRQLARQYRAPLVVADDAGHQIPSDAPDLVAHVIEAVRQAAAVGGPCQLDEQGLAAVGGQFDRT